MNEPGTYHFKGPAAVWVDGVKRYDRCCTADPIEHVEELDAFGGDDVVELPTRWDGFISGLSEENLVNLHALGAFELRLRNGHMGHAVLPIAGAYLQGLGEAPL